MGAKDSARPHRACQAGIISSQFAVPAPQNDRRRSGLTPVARLRHNCPLHSLIIMGQQTNKHIKKKRRVAYHKRRNARLKAARTKK